MPYILEDIRCHREAKKIHGVLYLISVYAGNGRLFFNAYNPDKSYNRHISVLETYLSTLLAPNSQTPKNKLLFLPPKTHRELCSRVVDLITTEQISKEFKDTRTLACRKKLTKLSRSCLLVSGYRIILTIFEEAKGCLYCVAYIPAYSATVCLLCTKQVFGPAMPNFDDELELSQINSSDMNVSLIPVIDRLQLSPSWTLREDMGLNPSLISAINIGTSHVKTDNSGGMTLRFRTHGGPGRKFFQAVKKLSNGFWICFTGIECSTMGVLRIRVYNPFSSHEVEMRFTPLDRLCLLGSLIDGDYKTWVSNLYSRATLKATDTDQREREFLKNEEELIAAFQKKKRKLSKDFPQENSIRSSSGDISSAILFQKEKEEMEKIEIEK